MISKRVWILIKYSWDFVLFTRVLSSKVPLVFSSTCAPGKKTLLLISTHFSSLRSHSSPSMDHIGSLILSLRTSDLSKLD